jgi:hypothetical protein
VFAGRSRYHSRQNTREHSLSPPPVAARRHARSPATRHARSPARRYARSPERSPFGHGPTHGVSPFARAASTPVSNDDVESDDDDMVSAVDGETPDKKRKRSVGLDQLVPYASDDESL